jgi:hypothetical protein
MEHMSAVRDKPDLDRGAALAQELGWPTESIGALGVMAGLVDAGASYRPARSYNPVFQRYRTILRRDVERRMAERIKQLSR